MCEQTRCDQLLAAYLPEKLQPMNDEFEKWDMMRKTRDETYKRIKKEKKIATALMKICIIKNLKKNGK